MKAFALRGPTLLAIGCLLLLARVPVAQAQNEASYHLWFNSNTACGATPCGALLTPNPFPPVVSLTQGGQLNLELDSVFLSNFDIEITSFFPLSGGTGNAFLAAAPNGTLTLAPGSQVLSPRGAPC